MELQVLHRHHSPRAYKQFLRCPRGLTDIGNRQSVPLRTSHRLHDIFSFRLKPRYCHRVATLLLPLFPVAAAVEARGRPGVGLGLGMYHNIGGSSSLPPLASKLRMLRAYLPGPNGSGQ